MPPAVPQTGGERISTAIAGEYFVVAELARRGWVATLTAKNTPVIDVLAAKPEGGVHAQIQVKTRTKSYTYAHRVGALRLSGPRDFLVLVDLGELDEGPRYWVIPGGEAEARVTSEQLRTKDITEFEGRWDLLEA